MIAKLYIPILILYFLLLILTSSCQTHELSIGSPAPELVSVQWIQSPPLKLKDLKGKVVLLRWWTDECIFCINSADALNEWYQMYADSGLVIIGLYHPKPEPKTCNPEDVREYAGDKEFHFPIAIDDQWLNLKKFWLNNRKRDFTSASFLIDRNGIIRYIHPGGEYHKEFSEGHQKCVDDYNALQTNLIQCIRTK